MSEYSTAPWPVNDVSLLRASDHHFTNVFSEADYNSSQIVYTAIVGTVMAAAFLEWFLWLGAFLYCLFKVYQKAEHWSVKVLAVVIAILFALLRYSNYPGPRTRRFSCLYLF